MHSYTIQPTYSYSRVINTRLFSWNRYSKQSWRRSVGITGVSADWWQLFHQFEKLPRRLEIGWWKGKIRRGWKYRGCTICQWHKQYPDLQVVYRPNNRKYDGTATKEINKIEYFVPKCVLSNPLFRFLQNDQRDVVYDLKRKSSKFVVKKKGLLYIPGGWIQKEF